MKKQQLIYLIYLLILLLTVACGPGTAVPSTAPIADGQAQLNAQATLAAVQFNQQGTATAVAQATAIFYGTVTAEAWATRHVQMTREAEGTATAVAIQATADARQADLHQLNIARQQQDLAATATQAAIQQKLDEALVADQIAQLEQARQAEAMRLRWQATLNDIVKPTIALVLGLLLFVAGSALIFLGARWLYLRFNPVVVVQQGPGQTLLVQQGYVRLQELPALGRPVRALPARVETGGGESEEQKERAETSQKLPPPRWEALTHFLTHGDGTLIPLGVDRRRRPLLIDRNQKPHLAIAAATGAGKTTSIVIPYVTALATQGVHVLVINGKGADFMPFQNFPNITLLPRFSSREEAPLRLNQLLQQIVAEMDRRDGVLARYGVRSWYELPARAGEAGELALVIDEYLSITDEAARLASYKGLGRDERDVYGVAVQDMWHALKILTREARKFGIYVIVTMTDPTREQLGQGGMAVRRQMVAVALRMNSGAASRAFVDLPTGSDFAQGTVGLPTGEFLCNVGGRIIHAAGFYPQPEQVGALLLARPVAPNPLPEGLSTAVVGAMAPLAEDAPPMGQGGQGGLGRAERNGRLLDVLAKEGELSLNQVALFLADREGGEKANGDDYKLAAEALGWRLRVLGDDWATAVVARSRSGYVQPLKQELGLA